MAKLYASIVEKSLEKAGFQVVRFEFLQGEASKNLTTVSKVYDFLATQGMTRSDGIVALGGGVVGDLAGFAASTYMRGISFVQIPTKLNRPGGLFYRWKDWSQHSICQKHGGHLCPTGRCVH